MNKPCSARVFTIRIKPGFSQNCRSQGGGTITSLLIFLHKFSGQRPMLYCSDHILSTSETNDRSLVGEHAFGDAIFCRTADRVKSFTKPELSKRECLMTREMQRFEESDRR